MSGIEIIIFETILVKEIRRKLCKIYIIKIKKNKSINCLSKMKPLYRLCNKGNFKKRKKRRRNHD